MRDHKQLKAFQLSDVLVIKIYQVTRFFPKDEMYGIVSQMRRAALSVPSNIVEGCTRRSDKDYLRFLEIVFGSLRELSYQFTVARRLGYVKDIEDFNFKKKIEEVEKVLGSLIRSRINRLRNIGF